MFEFGKVLPRLILRSGDSDESRRQAVFAAWIGVAGAMLGRATAPVAYEKKTLTVATTGETWSVQLQAMAPQLLFRLNSALGAPLVTSLQFRYDEAAVRRFHPRPNDSVDFIDPESASKPIEPRTAGIKDPDLRRQFLRTAGKCLDRRSR